MSDVVVTIATGVALGVTYGLLGAAVSVVWIATRTLHLAIGPVVVAGVLVRLFLDVEVLVDLPAVVAIVLGLGVAAVVSTLLEPLVVRPLQDAAALLIGLAVAGVVLETAVVRLFGARTYRPQPVVGGDGPVELVGVTIAGPVVTAVLVGAPLVALLWWVVSRSRFGRALRLVGGSPPAAELLGVSATGTRARAFAVAGASGAFAGLLIAPVATVGVTQGGSLTLRAVAAAALLGVAGPGRALVAGLVLGITEALAQHVAPQVPGDVTVGLVVVATLVATGARARRSWGRAW